MVIKHSIVASLSDLILSLGDRSKDVEAADKVRPMYCMVLLMVRLHPACLLLSGEYGLVESVSETEEPKERKAFLIPCAARPGPLLPFNDLLLSASGSESLPIFTFSSVKEIYMKTPRRAS